MIACTHCKFVIDGDAVVSGDKVWHTKCVAPYNRSLKGLIHECPKCKTTGKIDDPKGSTKMVEVPLAYGETPDCAYGGCFGCHYCHENVKSVKVPVQITCDLCKGVGWLTQEPTPVMKVVDWKLK